MGAKRLDLSVTAVPTYAQQTLSVWTNLVSGSAGGTWGTSANWSGGVPNATDAIADFSTLNITATSIVTNDTARTVGTLRFGDTTTASSNWIVTNSTLALATTIGLPFITVSNQTATIYSILTGSQGLIKNGAGTLSLNTVNNFTGGTTVDQGTLTLNASDSSTPAVCGTVTVNAGGTLSIAGPAWVGFGNSTYKITTLNIVGGTVSNTSATAFIKDATVNMTAGTWTGVNCYWVNSTLNVLASANPSTLAGAISFRKDYGSTNLNIVVADGAAATDLLISGAVSDNNGNGVLTKSGPGTLGLTAINSYAGVTMVNNGVLRVDGTLSAGGGEVQVSAGATLAGTGTVARVITVASNAVLTAGNPAVTNRVGTFTTTASTTLAAGATYTVRIGVAGCDTLAATGGLTLTEGAELSVIADPILGRFPPGYSVTIATGTVTGRFKQSVINLPNQPQLKVSYTGNTIKLIFPNGTLIRFL
jgi:autotransporter-associated beta strand protein